MYWFGKVRDYDKDVHDPEKKKNTWLNGPDTTGSNISKHE
jgi:hypothetical protein